MGLTYDKDRQARRISNFPAAVIAAWEKARRRMGELTLDHTAHRIAIKQIPAIYSVYLILQPAYRLRANPSAVWAHVSGVQRRGDYEDNESAVD